MGTASARPEKLQGFVTAAAEIRSELASRITELRASYDAFQSTGSPVSNPDLMDVELPGLLANYELDENFVAVTRQAFLDANTGVDGATITVDQAALDTAFSAAAVAMEFDPAQLTTPRAAVTVDEPVAAGTPQTSGFVADPVCTATGHFLEVEDDFTCSERLDVLRWRRTYSSRFVASGPFGRGWASWASTALLPNDEDGTVGYQGPDGQLAVFVPAAELDDPPGSYAQVPGIAARLVRLEPGNGHGAGGWELRWQRQSLRPGVVWTFDHDGLPRTADDPARGRVTFTHTGGLLTRVAHEGGRRLDLDWVGARITLVRSSCGRVARYHYDDAGDLVRSERVPGARRYEVDGSGRIVEVWDADGVRLCRNTFDDEGRVLVQVSPFGRETTFAYHPGHRTVVSDTGGGPVNVYEHDPLGRLVGLIDDQGHVLRRVFDGAGRVVAAHGFDGATTRQDFAADGRSAAHTGADGGRQSWEYDEQGRVTRHAIEGGAEVRYEYADDHATVPTRMVGPLGWEMRFEATGGLVTSLTDADGVTVHHTHDADGNITTTTNALGATTLVEHHPSGEAVRITRPDGGVTVLERDDAGRLLSARSPVGDEVTVTWTPAGRIAAVVAPDDGLTTFEYGAHGALDRVVDALGATVELTHDHLERLVAVVAPNAAKWDLDYTGTGRLAQLTDPSGGSWGFAYDPEGRPVRTTDPLGHATDRRYDVAGRLAEVVDPEGGSTRHTHDALGRVTATEAPDGGVTTTDWDVWGRPVAVRMPDGDERRTQYTPAGRVRSVTTAGGRGVTFRYDAAGRVESATDASGAETRSAWDACDRLVGTTSPAGRETRWGYDLAGRVVEHARDGRTWRTRYAAGRPVAVTDPAGATTRYRYDLRSQLTSALDAGGRELRLRHDDRGDLVAVVDPLGGITSTEYDAMRRPVATSDQLGRRTALHRDAAGRVVRRESPTGTVVEWRRDARGLVADVRVDGRDTIVFDRDAAGRPVLVHEPGPNRTFTFEWTRGGRLNSVDVDGATMRWDRDRDGLVTARRDPAGRLTTTRHDAAGRAVAVASERWGTVELDRDLDGRLVALRADGVTRRWDRDAAGVVVGYAETGPAGESTTTLRRDAAGRVVEARTPAGLATYGYDAAGQLVSAVTPAGAWTWTYDAAGRLVGERGPDGETAYDYDGAHQLVRCTGPAGTTGFTYDAARRRVAEDGPAGARRFTWDGLGRLAAVGTDAEGTIEVDVDALGNVARFGATRFGWDVGGGAPAELAAVDDREVVSVAGHAVALAGPGGIDWLAADWRRSVAAPDGHALDPWGAAVVGTAAGRPSPAPGFAGELDLGGLTWLRNRVYDPATRQLLTPDPLPGTPGTSVAAWPYHYGSNDPVGHVDPLGLQALTIDQYEEYRAQETSVQWSNIAMVGVGIAAAFVPGGPLVAAAVGAAVSMAPGIYEGITTGEWDAGALVRNGVVGALSGGFGKVALIGMTGRVAIPAATSVPGAIVRTAAVSGTTSTAGEVYDVLGGPGGDGRFNPESVIIDTTVGATAGGLEFRLSGPRTAPFDPIPDPVATPVAAPDVPPVPDIVIPPGAGELYVPPGAGQLWVPPGAGELYVPTGAGELWLPPGAGELTLPSGDLVGAGAPR